MKNTLGDYGMTSAWTAEWPTFVVVLWPDSEVCCIAAIRPENWPKAAFVCGRSMGESGRKLRHMRSAISGFAHWFSVSCWAPCLHRP